LSTIAGDRVARWHIFTPNFPIEENFGGCCNGRCWYILQPFGLFYGYLVYFVAIWLYFVAFGLNFVAIRYILCLFGIFYTILVCCTKKYLATLGPVDIFVTQNIYFKVNQADSVKLHSKPINFDGNRFSQFFSVCERMDIVSRRQQPPG
jgi:hypothetical protein